MAPSRRRAGAPAAAHVRDRRRRRPDSRRLRRGARHRHPGRRPHRGGRAGRGLRRRPTGERPVSHRLGEAQHRSPRGRCRRRRRDQGGARPASTPPIPPTPELRPAQPRHPLGGVRSAGRRPSRPRGRDGSTRVAPACPATATAAPSRHVVLEQAPDACTATRAGRPPRPAAARVFPLSGASAERGPEYAGARSPAGDRQTRPARGLDDSGTPSPAAGRICAPRPTVVARDRAELVAALRPSRRRVAARDRRPVGRLRRRRHRARLGVLRPRLAVGRAWVANCSTTEPAFAAGDRRDRPDLRRARSVSRRAQMLSEGELVRRRPHPADDLRDAGRRSPPCGGAQGVDARPRCVGHSVGEIAAAVAAGVLTQSDGARLICRRSALLRRVAGSGAHGHGEPAVRGGRSDGWPTGPTWSRAIAASPSSTVISGDCAAVDAVSDQWTDAGARRTPGRLRRRVPQPAHGPAARRPGRRASPTCAPAAARIPVYTTALDDPRGDRTRATAATGRPTCATPSASPTAVTAARRGRLPQLRRGVRRTPSSRTRSTRRSTASVSPSPWSPTPCAGESRSARHC